MATIDKGTIRRLDQLDRLCKAGERGFEVVASNVSNRGLKVLLRTYAQQRGQFAEALESEIQHLGGKVLERDSLRGIIHRGRINIFAALTIGAHNVEDVVLNEASLGEKAAVRAYKGVLAKELPAEARALIEQQYAQIQETSDQVHLLRGRSGKRLVVRMFESGRDVEGITLALERAGFSADSLEAQDANDAASVHMNKGNRVHEAVISGAVGGAIWGSLIGAVAGVGTVMIPGVQPVTGGNLQSLWAMITLSSMLAGALAAAFLGFLIGVGVSAEDTYLYADNLKHGAKLMLLHTDNTRAAEAAQILQQVDVATKAHDMNESWQMATGR